MSTATAGPCDRGVAHAVAARPAGAKPAAHPTGTLAATILGSSLAFIDGSVVNVALPAIGRDLGVAGGDVSWLINAYLLPVGSLVLLGGVAGDLWGRKRVFLAGMTLFTLASLACALAPGFGLLLAARAAQGLGAAFMIPASLALIGAAFSGEARGRAVGTWAAAGAITSALGPLAGGWLVDVVGWRPIFLINLPIALVAGSSWWTNIRSRRWTWFAPSRLDFSTSRRSKSTRSVAISGSQARARRTAPEPCTGSNCCRADRSGRSVLRQAPNRSTS